MTVCFRFEKQLTIFRLRPNLRKLLCGRVRAVGRVRERPHVTRTCLSLEASDRPKDAQAVAEATEPADGWTRQFLAAREEKDPGRQRETLEKLATSADVHFLTAAVALRPDNSIAPSSLGRGL